MRKRILHVALGRHNPEMEKAIAALGTETKLIDWTVNRDKINAMLMKDTDFDLAFFHLQHKDIVSKEAVRAIRGVKVNWTGDVREDIEWYRDMAPAFTWTLFSNETDVVRMKAYGHQNTAYLQVGFQESIYNMAFGEALPGHDIVFMANNYGCFPLSQYRKDAILFLKQQYGNQFGLYGAAWVSMVKNLNGTPHEEAAIYRGSKIGISISHFNYDRYYSDRMLRIMACGCMCLSYHYLGIEKDWEVGKEVVTFHDFNEMREKIDYYLAHEEERKAIAVAGHKKVWATCKWSDRMEELKRIIDGGLQN